MKTKTIFSTLMIATLVAASACSSDNKNNNGGGDGGAQQACTPNQKECLDDNHARICSKEGSQWYVVTCDDDEMCKDGDCVDQDVTPPPVQVCFPGDGKCMPGASGAADQSLLCNDDGTAYVATACPTGTACVGGGVCTGICAVGSSICTDTNTLSTCNNGTSYTSTACGANQACVATGDTPFDTAACMPSACTPSATGCDFACGNKHDATADQTKAVSFCMETPSGFQWSVITCAGPQICDPTAGGACGDGTQANAGCAVTCIDGTQMCDANGATLTCTEGKWSDPVACATGTTCIVAAASTGKTLCGDPVCGVGTGICTVDGKWRACGSDGKLAATGTDCATGVCTATGAAVGGVTPGACTVICQDGDTQCADPDVIDDPSPTFQTCVKGIWSTLDNCATDTSCYPSTSATGRPSHICGACQPGWTSCGPDIGGDVYNRRELKTCDATGKWGDLTPCALGRCDDSNQAGVDDVCLADCVPNQKYCRGTAVTTLPAKYVATNEADTCTSFGLFPIKSADAALIDVCTTGKSCRLNVSGEVVGCQPCVYNNEYGLIDSQCTSSTKIRFCKADNTWDVATTCASGTNCANPTDPALTAPIVFAAPALPNQAYCHACQVEGTSQTFFFSECTQKALVAAGGDCSNVFDGDTSSLSCASRLGGTDADCCTSACFQDTFGELPKSAVCTTGN